MYFEIYRQSKGTPSTGKGQWRWRLRAGNHETVASGESYVNKADCLHVIELIKGVQGRLRSRKSKRLSRLLMLDGQLLDPALDNAGKTLLTAPP